MTPSPPGRAGSESSSCSMEPNANLLVKAGRKQRFRTSSSGRKSSEVIATKFILFTFSKDEWNIKEDSGKSMKNALDIATVVYQKAPFGLKRCQTVKKSIP